MLPLSDNLAYLVDGDQQRSAREGLVGGENQGFVLPLWPKSLP